MWLWILLGLVLVYCLFGKIKEYDIKGLFNLVNKV